MKLITSPQALEAEFARLINDHDAFLCATAWAGVASKPFQALQAAPHKIRRVVVGLHFYQTHPDFIQAFHTHKGVRFINQTEGTFHPKLYLFCDDGGGWELLVGSGNLTNAAFTVNAEATLLISHVDDASGDVLKSAIAMIEDNWNDAESLTRSQLDDYRKMWQNQQPKLGSLSSRYGGEKPWPTRPNVPVGTMTWKDFIQRVRREKVQWHTMRNRLRVVTTARTLFKKYGHFNEMPVEERKFVAGLPSELETERIDSGWFGSMHANGIFRKCIGLNDANISRALDQVPLNGEVTRRHYLAFVREYRKTFTGNCLATATRLLAMKRPDTFVCFDRRNKVELCKAFGIPQAGMDYARYWDDIVVRIRYCVWYQNPQPKGKDEDRVCEARAAFLDSLYYRE